MQKNLAIYFLYHFLFIGLYKQIYIMTKHKEYNEFIKVSAVSEALTGYKNKARPDMAKMYRAFFIDLNLMVKDKIEEKRKELQKKQEK